MSIQLTRTLLMNPAGKIIIALLVLSLSGCVVTFPDTITEVKEWPLAVSKEKKSVGVTFGARGIIKPEKGTRHYITLGKFCLPYDEYEPLCYDLKETGEYAVIPGYESVRAFRESGLFSEVKTDGSPADVNVQLKVLQRSVRTGWMWPQMFTLFLIPVNTVSLDMTVRMTFKNREDKVIEKVRKVGAGSVWVGILMFPAYFFGHSMSGNIEYDITRSIIIEAHQKGII